MCSVKGIKRLVACAVLAAVAASTAACSSNAQYGSASSTAAYSAEMAAPSARNMTGGEYEKMLVEEAAMDMAADAGGNYSTGGGEAGSGSTLAPTVNPARKMIRRVYLAMETKEYDALTTAISAQVALLGGYIENSEQSGGSYIYDDMGQPAPRGNRSAYVVARVPRDQVDAFIEGVSKLGSVRSRQDSVEDVTLQYVDIESHKKSLLVEQERLLELLGRAEQLEDIIALEARMSEVRYQLESYESQLRVYDNQIDYSTVTISVDEVERITPIEEKTVWSRISAGFANTLYRIGEGAQDFFVWLVVNLPYLILWAVILAVLAIIARRVLRRRNADGTKKQRLGKKGGQAEEPTANSDAPEKTPGE